MQKTLDVLMSFALVAFILYILAFAIVGACLVGSSQPVAECRDNVAGTMVYEVITMMQ